MQALLQLALRNQDVLTYSDGATNQTVSQPCGWLVRDPKSVYACYRLLTGRTSECVVAPFLAGGTTS